MNVLRRYERGQWITSAVTTIRRTWGAVGWLILIPWALIIIGAKT